MKIKQILVLLLIVLFSGLTISAQDKGHNWRRLNSGTWEINNSRAVQTKTKISPWNYYYILDYNTILSLQDLSGYSSIEYTAEVFDREESPVEFIVSFAVRSEYKNWFYHMYGFRFTGDYWNIDKVELIHSDRKDKTQPWTVKLNKFVTVLATAECKVKYGKVYNYKISFEGNDVVLYINNEKIMSAPRPIEDITGRIAFSSGNSKLAIDKVSVIKQGKVIFEDDFNTDSIFVKKLEATVEKQPKDKEEKDK